MPAEFVRVENDFPGLALGGKGMHGDQREVFHRHAHGGRTLYPHFGKLR